MIALVVDHIAANPQAGDLIKGSGGVRKVRIAKPGGGKSQRANVSQVDVNEMAKLIKELKAEARRKQE